MMFRFASWLVCLFFAVSAEASFLASTENAPLAPRIVVDSNGAFDTVDEAGRSCAQNDSRCTEPVEALKGSSLPLFISKRALRACGDATQLTAQLEVSAQKAMKALRKGFYESPSLTGELDVVVVLDHFGAQIAKSRSFYLRRFPSKWQGRIVLDCQDSTRAEWAGLLAHEFAHVALERSFAQGEAWQEEMIAQILEVEAGGNQPERNLRSLEQVEIWPGLAPAEPGEKVMSSALYAQSYLFGKYLMRLFGGWKFIRDLNSARVADYGDCHSRYTPFACAILTMARSGSFVESGDLHPYDYSAQELLTKFALASTLNTQQVPWLWIGGRVQAKVLNAHPVKFLNAQQFYAIDASAELPKNSKLSVYVLGPEIANRRRYFQTLANAFTAGWKKPTEPGQGRLLIVNQTDGSLSLD